MTHFFDMAQWAKPSLGFASGLFIRHPSRLIFKGAHFKMKAQLLLYVLIYLLAAEQIAERFQEAFEGEHLSSCSSGSLHDF